MDPVKLIALAVIIWMTIELVYHLRTEIGWVLRRIRDAWKLGRFLWSHGRRGWRLVAIIIALLKRQKIKARESEVRV